MQNRIYAQFAVMISKLFFWSISLLLIVFAIFLASRQIGYVWDWWSIWKYRQKFIDGWLMTVSLSLSSLVASLFLAVLFLALQKSTSRLVCAFSEFWVQLIRGTPFLVQILVFYYVIATALGTDNRFLMSILILSNFSAAYSTEILRASLESLSKDQSETARSFGMTAFQSLRYVIAPQVFRQSLPGLAGQLCSLVKDSSLLSIIAVGELTLNAQEVNSLSYSTLEAYVALTVGYLLLTWPISYFSKFLEAQFKYGN